MQKLVVVFFSVMLILLSTQARGVQVLSPKRAGAAIDVQALPAGTDLVSGGLLEIDLEYSTTPSQTGNESGIGFKLQYDSVYFDVVDTNASVTSVFTKCMVALPSDQPVSGSMREIVFGWLDTSVRVSPNSGSVGWPATADQAAPGTASGCFNPGGIVKEQGASTPPLRLFRLALRSKSTFSSGQTTLSIKTDSNFSHVFSDNRDTDKSIRINGIAAPVVNGVCGAAHQTVATSSPIALCVSGTPSAVTGTGRWNWTCSGTNGGTSTSCTTEKLTAACSNFTGSLLGGWRAYGTVNLSGVTFTVGDAVGYDTSDADADCNITNVWGTGSSTGGNAYDFELLTYTPSDPRNVDVSWSGCISTTAQSYHGVEIREIDPAFSGVPATGLAPYKNQTSIGFLTRWDQPGLFVHVERGGVNQFVTIPSAALSSGQYCGSFRLVSSASAREAYFNGVRVHQDAPLLGVNQMVVAQSFDAPITLNSPIVTTPGASVNGQCGASNGVTFGTAPTTSLCAVGTASTVGGTGPWTWTCQGVGVGSTASCSTAVSDVTAPETVISGCPVFGRGNNASLSFSGTDNVAVTGFECSVDGGAYSACASPYSFSTNSIVVKTVSVRAKDLAGNLDQTPATCSITAAVKSDPLPPLPPVVSANIASGVSGGVATLRISAADADRFECSINSAAFETCASTTTLTNLPPGLFKVDVRSVNANGVSAATSNIWVVAAADKDASHVIPTLDRVVLSILGLALIGLVSRKKSIRLLERTNSRK
jgi:hypothetical protein